jgi:putative inorganic carbon (HCO3(-)) transporter
MGAAALAVLLIGAPLVLLLLRRGSVAAGVLLFILYTRASDLAIHRGTVSSVSPAGLSVAAQAVLLLMTAVVFVQRTRHGGSSTGKLRVAWMASFLYLAVVLASSVWAADEGAAASQGISLLKNLVIAYLIAELLISRRAQRIGVWGLVCAAGAMAGLTVVQAATHSYHTSYLGFAQAPIRQIVGSTNSYRSAGPIGDPNFYALVLAVVVPLAVYRVRDERRGALKLAAAAVVLITLVAIALTYSRGGILTVAIALVLCGLLLRPRPRDVAVVIGVLAGVTLLLPGSVIGRVTSVTSKTDSSISDRLGSERVALEMFIDHPILGVGANNFAETYFPYALRLNVPGAANKPHNTYLSIAAETGLVGLLSFGAAMATLLIAVWKKRTAARAAGDRVMEGLAASVFVALSTYLVGVSFLPIAYPRYLWVIAGVALAIAASPVIPAPARRVERPLVAVPSA